jgi:hypothetical protein
MIMSGFREIEFVSQKKERSHTGLIEANKGDIKLFVWIQTLGNVTVGLTQRAPFTNAVVAFKIRTSCR